MLTDGRPARRIFLKSKEKNRNTFGLSRHAAQLSLFTSISISGRGRLSKETRVGPPLSWRQGMGMEMNAGWPGLEMIPLAAP
jgi:hypothetical protein